MIVSVVITHIVTHYIVANSAINQTSYIASYIRGNKGALDEKFICYRIVLLKGSEESQFYVTHCVLNEPNLVSINWVCYQCVQYVQCFLN